MSHARGVSVGVSAASVRLLRQCAAALHHVDTNLMTEVCSGTAFHQRRAKPCRVLPVDSDTMQQFSPSLLEGYEDKTGFSSFVQKPILHASP
eukprot:2394545-Amphidinium_carterae.2